MVHLVEKVRDLASYPLLCAVLFLATGCSSTPKPDPLSKPTVRITTALDAAAVYLISKQSDDGAWRSGVYSVLKDGPALTPHVAGTLTLLNGNAETRTAFSSACAYIASQIRRGTVDPGYLGFTYPAYIAAGAASVLALENNPEHAGVRDEYIKLLRSQQLNDALGWKPTDTEYGGWSYAPRTPRRPADLSAHLDTNLSATLYAADALRLAGVPQSDLAWKGALAFVERCQNFAESSPDKRFDDGGFFCSPTMSLLNKAGVAGKDARGHERFNSYASMTADGVRALLDCGLPLNHPRVVAARAWLERDFSAFINGGVFAPDRDKTRNATYYYYAWTVACAFRQLGARDIQTHHGKVNWAKELSSELLERQRSDGSWINKFNDAKEDDPLVATPFAAAALKICSRFLPAD